MRPWSFALLMMCTMLACDTGVDGIGVRRGTGHVVLDVAQVRQALLSASFPYDTLTVQVAAPDMQTPLAFTVDKAAMQASFAVPAGPSRVFSITASIEAGNTGIPVFWGQSIVDVPPDGTLDLQLQAFSAGTAQGILTVSDATPVPDAVHVQATAVGGRPNAPSTVDIVAKGGRFSQALPTGSWSFNGTFTADGNTYVLAQPPVLSVTQGTFSYVTLSFVPNDAGPATYRIKFVSQPNDVVASSPFSVTVGIIDGSGTVVPTQSGNVTVILQGASSNLQGPTLVATNQGVAEFDGLSISKAAQGYSLTATSATYGPANSNTFSVAAGALAGLSFLNFPHDLTTASGPTPMVVAAVDTLQNPVPSYVGTVTFASSDGSATLPAPYTYVAADAGVHTFSPGVQFATAGSQSVTVRDSLGMQGRATATVTSTAPTAYHFALSGGADEVAGVAQGNIVVSVLAASNAVNAGYTGAVSFSSSDARATLPALYTYVAADAGVHTFAGVTLVAEGNQTLTVADPAGTVASASQTFTVSAAAVSAYHLNVLTSTTVGARTSFSVQAQDPYGNVNPAYTGTATFTSSDAAITFSDASYPFVAADAGAHTFTATFGTPGTKDIVATDVATTTITGTASVSVQ